MLVIVINILNLIIGNIFINLSFLNNMVISILEFILSVVSKPSKTTSTATPTIASARPTTMSTPSTQTTS